MCRVQERIHTTVLSMCRFEKFTRIVQGSARPLGLNVEVGGLSASFFAIFQHHVFTTRLR